VVLQRKKGGTKAAQGSKTPPPPWLRDAGQPNPGWFIACLFPMPSLHWVLVTTILFVKVRISGPGYSGMSLPRENSYGLAEWPPQLSTEQALRPLHKHTNE
jgi:hypothetical protein